MLDVLLSSGPGLGLGNEDTVLDLWIPFFVAWHHLVVVLVFHLQSGALGARYSTTVIFIIVTVSRKSIDPLVL